MKFGIILGSTREGRVSPQVGAYIQEIANQRSEHQFEIVDVKAFDLPFMGTAEPNLAWNKNFWIRWLYLHRARIQPRFAASLKNAVDSAREEWFDKAAGIVSYGSGGGIRAAEQLRNVLAEQKLPPCGPTQPSTYLLILKVSVPSNPVSTWLRVSMIC